MREASDSYGRFKAFITDFYERVLKTNASKREKGDDLGIFIYFFLLVFFGLLYVFSDNPYIKSGLDFYNLFNYVVIIFLILYFAQKIYYSLIKKRSIKEDSEGINFISIPSIGNIFTMLIFVMIMWMFAVGMRWILVSYAFPSITADELNHFIFQVVHIIPTEELVFRGAFFIIIYIGLAYLLRHQKDSKERIELMMLSGKKKMRLSQWDKKEIFIWYVCILVSGIVFGLYHFPKFYDENTFPYLINGIHIAVPMLYLSFLGILLGICRYKYGLVASLLLHVINNFFTSALIFIL